MVQKLEGGTLRRRNVFWESERQRCRVEKSMRRVAFLRRLGGMEVRRELFHRGPDLSSVNKRNLKCDNSKSNFSCTQLN